MKAKVLSFEEQLVQDDAISEKSRRLKCYNWKAYLYGLVALVALFICVHSTWHFESSSKITTRHGLMLFAFGGIFFTSSFQFSREVLAAAGVLVRGNKLSVADVSEISNKIVSSIQALFCCITGYVIWTHSCCKDVVRANHFISHAYAYFGSAYFFYDIWSMYRVHVATPPGHVHTPSAASATPAALAHGDAISTCSIRRFLRYVALNPIIVGHHLFIGIFGFAVIITLKGNLGDCVFGFMYLMEASTPFVSLRSALSRFHMKKTKLYIYNGFAMLVVFFLCRVAMFPYVIYLYARNVNLSFMAALVSLPRGCKLSIGILMFPQIYWFYLMMKGATKIIICISTPLKHRQKVDASELPDVGGNTIMNDADDDKAKADKAGKTD